tara:strand:+ start:397 stop:636 length:240 start_codon:yes stop_codon:yes gene_type:complete
MQAVLVAQVVAEPGMLEQQEQVIPLRLLFLKEIQEVLKVVPVMVVQVEEQEEQDLLVSQELLFHQEELEQIFHLYMDQE